MLDPAKVARVLDLWGAGLRNQRAIARQTGVSRVSVWRIVRGLRRIRRRPAEDRSSPFTRPTAICPTCGAICTQPCIACQARAAGQAKEMTDDRTPMTNDAREGREDTDAA